MSNAWDEAAPAESLWPSASTAQDAVIAGELQAQEFGRLGDSFAGMKIEGERRPERGPPPPRRPREYGT